MSKSVEKRMKAQRPELRGQIHDILAAYELGNCSLDAYMTAVDAIEKLVVGEIGGNK